MAMDRIEQAGVLCRALEGTVFSETETEAKKVDAKLRLAVWLALLQPERGIQLADDFFKKIPFLRDILRGDIHAALEGDPAAQNREEVMLAYPGFKAVTVQRMAHILWGLKIPLLPRLMTEYAHRVTGIDIHPGAQIGSHFFIDHGTGVVIGETTVIGDHVKLYQGVTLGGLSTRDAEVLRGKKRHPTIGNHVTVYANATILGGDTVIGDGCVIGANVFLTRSVPPNTTVRIKEQELEFLERNL